MKKYEIDILNCGDDSYMLMSKGHHDIELFKSECKKEYEHIGEYLDLLEKSDKEFQGLSKKEQASIIAKQLQDIAANKGIALKLRKK